MLNRKGGKWDGGYISIGGSGRRTYIIEREVRGRRFHVSTRAHTTEGAMAQLKRFEGDPLNFRPEGERAPDGLYLTIELAAEYRKWLLEERLTTKQYADEMTRHLADWSEALLGVDMRRLSLRDHLKAPLARWRSRQHRIIAIKGFCGWLRKERGLLTSATDATIDLSVPQGTPEKTRRKKGTTQQAIHAALAALEQPHRDILLVLAATGMHYTELRRFVLDAGSELVRPKDAHAFIVVRHKSTYKTGAMARIPLATKAHADAAERLRKEGWLPLSRTFNKHLKAACLKAQVPVFKAGVLRHTVGTFAVEQGATKAQVAEFLHHRDPRTTERFYLEIDKPAEQVPVPALRLIR